MKVVENECMHRFLLIKVSLNISPPLPNDNQERELGRIVELEDKYPPRCGVGEVMIVTISDTDFIRIGGWW